MSVWLPWLHDRHRNFLSTACKNRWLCGRKIIRRDTICNLFVYGKALPSTIHGWYWLREEIVTILLKARFFTPPPSPKGKIVLIQSACVHSETGSHQICQVIWSLDAELSKQSSVKKERELSWRLRYQDSAVNTFFVSIKPACSCTFVNTLQDGFRNCSWTALAKIKTYHYAVIYIEGQSNNQLLF